MSNEILDVPASNETKIPRWLIWTYIILPILGLIALFVYWEGSTGWLDRGHWRALQEAAKTTGPFSEP